MGIQSLGVGSGLALDDLVTQLLDAERAPREARIQEREDSLDAVNFWYRSASISS